MASISCTNDVRGRFAMKLVLMRWRRSLAEIASDTATCVKISACGYMSHSASSTFSPPRIATSQ
jgi:hypothetical protein